MIPATYASFHPVTTGEIADNNILSVDIGNGQVRTEDIGAGQVRTGDIANDAIQPNVHLVEGDPVINVPGFTAQPVANCPSGEKVTGGGFRLESTFQHVFQNKAEDADTWEVDVFNDSTNSLAAQAYAVCIGPMP